MDTIPLYGMFKSQTTDIDKHRSLLGNIYEARL